MGQHVDQVLSTKVSSIKSAVVSTSTETDLSLKSGNINEQVLTLFAIWSSTQSEMIDELGRGRWGGGRGKNKRYFWNCGDDHHILQCLRTIL